MKFKDLASRVLFYISVPTCVCCKERLAYTTLPLCPGCLEKYYDIKTRNCSICSKELNKCTCTNEFLQAHYVRSLSKVYRYVHDDPLPSNSLIYSLKRDNRADVLNFLSDELYEAITNTVEKPEECIFTNVPRRRGAVIKYGLDHAEELARSVAKRFSAEYLKLLISKTEKAQKKLGSRERLLNAKFALVKNAPNLEGKRIIIVDDIVTTGASMGASATLIRGLGTKKIYGAAVSIAYKDSYTPFENTDRFNIK